MIDSIEVVPTVVPKDAAEFAAAADIVRKFSRSIHLDIDDGVFAGAPTWPYLPSGDFKPFDLRAAGVSVEAHLMVKDPREAGDALASAGASLIVGHIEAFGSIGEARDALESWRDGGASVGIAILMNTPLESIAPVVDLCDVVQLMTIDVIGAQGAPFDQRANARIGQAHATYPRSCIAVDGGVSAKNIGDLVRFGARKFLVGSAIMKEPDPLHAYEKLLAIGKASLV